MFMRIKSTKVFVFLAFYQRIRLLTLLLILGYSPSLLCADLPLESKAPGKMIDLGDLKLHLDCRGQGSPTVILESGLGGSSLDWARVLPDAARITRVCAYDRAGYGWSEMGMLPRTSQQIVGELHALLQAANVEGPYILVGHSFGGFSVRLFASRFPQETAALILVDASHEDQFAQLRDAGLVKRASRTQRSMSGAIVPDNLPANLHDIAAELAHTTKAIITLQSEIRFFQQSADQVRWYSSLPDVSVVVLSRGLKGLRKNVQDKNLETVWRSLQDDLFIRRGCSHLIAESSGHYIQLDDPKLVVNTIQRLVEHDSR